ncbi:aminodeoxychorismate/anthranilate synthase component II [Rickettsiella endosymbiont of Miltochrista miniata]|uniref:anthranilate synthase component II n=1 Tax=Rickettsiella endosymbiont of Miltochrista miniata TaxID=3066239 RepID=UPI00313CC52F
MLLIIDNYDSFTYNLYQAVASFYSDVCVIRNDKITINDIKRMSPAGIILSPGPGRPETAGICVALIHALVAGELSAPLLGVCLGHQAITIALGGRVIQSEKIVHGKDDIIFHKQTGLYQKLTQPFKAGRYHSLISERATLPSTLIIDAENERQVIMGVRHHQLPIYGVQFHPESILTPEGPLLLREFLAICNKNSKTGVTDVA